MPLTFIASGFPLKIQEWDGGDPSLSLFPMAGYVNVLIGVHDAVVRVRAVRMHDLIRLMAGTEMGICWQLGAELFILEHSIFFFFFFCLEAKH